jgi:predicted Co/Zn/Cd cation transporter (cation efflux family)
MPFIAWQGLVCGRFPIIFEHLFKTLDMALCLFAVCHNRLRKLGISAALAILGGVRKIIFSAQ